MRGNEMSTLRERAAHDLRKRSVRAVRASAIVGDQILTGWTLAFADHEVRIGSREHMHHDN